MLIDATFLIVGGLALLVGVGIGYLIGHRIGLLRVFRTALLVKNPEMWELLHHYAVDEQEQKTKTHRRKPAG